MPNLSKDFKEQYGPLALLAGNWEGDKGDDIAPSDDRSTENNKYREHITFEAGGPVNNHEQTIYVLRYKTTAWRIGEENSFHEELGYWTWEPTTQETMKTFLIPRGMAVVAGGKASKDAREFTLVATTGSPVFGITSSSFLEKEFKVTKYVLQIKILDENTFMYESDTIIEMPGHEPFHHTDRNKMKRIS